MARYGTKLTMQTVNNIQRIARQNLTKNALNYYESGADYEQTLTDNQLAYQRYKVRPRVLNAGTSFNGDVDMSVEAFGKSFKSPIFLAPTAMQKMAHPDGEIGTATASFVTGSCMGVSTLSTTSYENLHAASPDAFLMMQLYVYKQRQLSEELIRRAEKAGFKAIILTIDTPKLGRRLADVKEKFKLPENLVLENFANVESLGAVSDDDGSGLMSYIAKNIENVLTWDDIAWIKSVSKLPLYLKGVLTREIAEQCLKSNVQGIIVSNHGGRQLDGVPATIDALAEVVRAVRGKLPVYVDGGVRNGSDVFKALALGADGVFLGRPVLYGLAYNGQKGVEEVVEIMKNELAVIMRLAGCSRISDINSSMVVHESQYGIFTKPKIKRNWSLTPDNPICMEDIKESIRLKLQGKDELSKLLNEQYEDLYDDAYKRYRLRPYRLRGIDSSNTKVDVFGTSYNFPVCLIDHDDVTNNIANEFPTTKDSFTVDDVTNVLWFLKMKDSPDHEEMIKSAQNGGYNGIVMDISSGPANQNVTSLKSLTSLPIIARGVLCKEDALVCIENGVDGIIVCNSTLNENLVPAIDILSEVTEVVRGRIPIFLEGGVRKGSDIFKAIGRGATSVIIDRPIKWGNVHQGINGVKTVLEILADEFERTMYLAGCANFNEIVPSMVVNERYYWIKSGTMSKL